MGIYRDLSEDVGSAETEMNKEDRMFSAKCTIALTPRAPILVRW